MAKSYLARVGPLARVAAAAAVLALAGCGRGGGLSDYDRMKQDRQNAAESLKGQGAKLEEKHYPQGSAWSVNLSGLSISDDMLRQVKQLGNVSELDLSKSTVTDDQLGLIAELNIATLVLKFDLSHTPITDAGLERLKNLIVLTEMNLVGTKVTPAGVERFKQRRQSEPAVRPFARNPSIRLN
jgi:hypothetical protein